MTPKEKSSLYDRLGYVLRLRDDLDELGELVASAAAQALAERLWTLVRPVAAAKMTGQHPGFAALEVERKETVAAAKARAADGAPIGAATDTDQDDPFAGL